MPYFPQNICRTVFYREHAAGTYGVFPYWVAEFVAELPWVAAKSLLYSVIVYFSIGFISDPGKVRRGEMGWGRGAGARCLACPECLLLSTFMHACMYACA